MVSKEYGKWDIQEKMAQADLILHLLLLPDPFILALRPRLATWTLGRQPLKPTKVIIFVPTHTMKNK
jgi:hypothetical protein